MIKTESYTRIPLSKRRIAPYFPARKVRLRVWFSHSRRAMIANLIYRNLVKATANQQLAETGLAEISEAISASRHILELEADWDSEKSPSYSEDTWDRMNKFLLSHFRESYSQYGIRLPIPKIYPGPRGSIDILWKLPKHELLINIPSDQSKPARFYGDDKGQLGIEGYLDTAVTNQGLLIWLTNLSKQTGQ